MEENTFNQNIPTIEQPETAFAIVNSLPDSYLCDGYYATTEKGAKYLRPEYVADYAENIAVALSSMKLTDYNGLLREMKRSKKSTLPFEARQTAVAEMLPKALNLVSHKKAPQILVDMIRANLNAIKTDEDWTAFYRHLDAITGYLSAVVKPTKKTKGKNDDETEDIE